MPKVMSTFTGLDLVYNLTDVSLPISIFSDLLALSNLMSTCPGLNKRHQGMSQNVKISFSQSESVYYMSHITKILTYSDMKYHFQNLESLPFQRIFLPDSILLQLIVLRINTEKCVSPLPFLF